MLWSKHSISQTRKSGLWKKWFCWGSQRMREPGPLGLAPLCWTTPGAVYIPWWETWSQEAWMAEERDEPWSGSQDTWDRHCLVQTFVKWMFDQNALIPSFIQQTWITCSHSTSHGVLCGEAVKPACDLELSQSQEPALPLEGTDPDIYTDRQNQCSSPVLTFKIPSSSNNKYFIIYF